MKWIATQDRETIDIENDSWTLSMVPDRMGWETDSGQSGYGLPKELAEWMCKQLNKSKESPPYIMDKYGYWEKKE